MDILFAIFDKILAMLLRGGPEVVAALLLVIVAFLLIERWRLLKEIRRRDEKMEEIVDDYYRGNITLSEVLASLKLVLHEIKARF